MIDDTVNDSTLPWPIDFDKDGNMDFVTNSVTDKTLTLYQNPGNQAFSRVPLILDTNYIKTFAIGDTDNDSDYDILIGQGTNPGILFFMNKSHRVHFPLTICHLHSAIQIPLLFFTATPIAT